MEKPQEVTLCLLVCQDSVRPLHLPLEQLRGADLGGLLDGGHRSHFSLGARCGAAGDAGQVLLEEKEHLTPAFLRGEAILTLSAGKNVHPSAEAGLNPKVPLPLQKPLVLSHPLASLFQPFHTSAAHDSAFPTRHIPEGAPTSEPDGEAGTLAAGEVGLLVLSGKSNDRSLRVESRGFFFFSASRSRGSEPEWLSARVRTPVRKSAISS